MIVQEAALNVPVSVAAGTALDVSKWGEKSIVITGTFTATYQPQISNDGTNWANVGSTLTAAGTALISNPCLWLRLNCTAFTSGAPVASCAGIANKRDNW